MRERAAFRWTTECLYLKLCEATRVNGAQKRHHCLEGNAQGMLSDRDVETTYNVALVTLRW